MGTPWLWNETDLTSLVAQTVKHLPTMQETQVQSLGREDPLEKEMATHSSTLAWKIPWTEKPGRLQSMGVVMYGCKSWTIKKADHQIIDVFNSGVGKDF